MAAAGPTTATSLVPLEVAALMIGQQYEHLLWQFSNHLLKIQDDFHEGFYERRQEFELSCRLLAPTVPLGQEEAVTMASRLEQLLDHFKRCAEKEIKQFDEDCFSVKGELNGLLVKIEHDAKDAERRRQDELTAATQLARREVTSTIAMVKSEHANSATEVTAMSSLQKALDATTAELDQVRTKLAQVQGESHTTAMHLREQVDEERERSRQNLSAERDSMAAKLREVVESSEKARRQHLDELVQINSQNATTVERVRSELERMVVEVANVKEENDRLREQLVSKGTHDASDRLELKKQIASLQFENDRLRASFDVERMETQNGVDDIRRVLETRKSMEVEEFKRRLIGSLGSPNSGAASRTTSITGLTHQQEAAAINAASSPAVQSARRFGSVGSNHGDVMLSSRGASPQFSGGNGGVSDYQSRSGTVLANLDIRAASLDAGGRSPSARGASARGHYEPPSSSRSPSETFMRLQNLSSNWKDRLSTL